MKKILFILLCVIVSLDVNAKEYKVELTINKDKWAVRECNDNVLCDLNGNLITGTVKFYFRGMLRGEGTYKDGKQNGVVKEYHGGGWWLKREALYEAGELVGPEKFYNEDGVLHRECSYVDGRQFCKSYYDNGKLKEEQSYKNGEWGSTSKSYYKNGALEKEVYKGGEKKYYESGALEMECSYNKGKKICKYYYESGALREDISYIGKERIDKEYYESGKIKSERSSVKGYKSYYESGALESVSPYKNGKFNGISKKYYENGMLKGEFPQKDNKTDGIVKEYYMNGELEHEVLYKNGQKDGIEKWYYESGAKKTEIPYKNGKINGVGKEFYEDGKLKKELSEEDMKQRTYYFVFKKRNTSTN